MTETPATTSGFTVEQFQAAREIIRDYVMADTPMSIYELLEALGEERFPTTPDMYRLLHLIYHLQADPHIRQETSDWNPIEFIWSDEERVHGLYGLGGQPW